MAGPLTGRHFLKLLDFTPDEIRVPARRCRPASRPTSGPAGGGSTLAGKSVALIFEKPSTRTRCAFTVACVDEGAHPEYLGKGDIQLGKKETVADTARVLGRMFDGIQFRGFAHETVEELAAVRRRAGLERAHRRLAPDPDPGRPADGAGGVRRPATGSHSPTPATAATTWPARSWWAAPSSAWTSASSRRRRCTPSRSWSRPCAAIAAETGGTVTVTDSVEDGVARRPRRLHRRLGVDGRGGQDRRADRAAQAVQGDPAG